VQLFSGIRSVSDSIKKLILPESHPSLHRQEMKKREKQTKLKDDTTYGQNTDQRRQAA
jgi:hypothetical protein